VRTSSGALQQTVDQRSINDIPLNGRSTLELALTLPGVAGSAGTECSGFSTNEPVFGHDRMNISFSPDTI
jgi:hypothetical protein